MGEVVVRKEDRKAAAEAFEDLDLGACANRVGQHFAAMVRAAHEDDHPFVQAFAQHRLAAVAEAAKPWADYHGDLPDYDHPLRPVFESGIQYAVELLAKELGVEDWTPCDGTEEFDGDLGGTLMNIVLEAMPKDEHGDPIYPRDLPGNVEAPSA
jgi:hypothetical protein